MGKPARLRELFKKFSFRKVRHQQAFPPQGLLSVRKCAPALPNPATSEGAPTARGPGRRAEGRSPDVPTSRGYSLRVLGGKRCCATVWPGAKARMSDRKRVRIGNSPAMRECPARWRRKGTPRTCMTTCAEATCPGSPQTSVWPQRANINGLPGLSATPWQRISVSPKDCRASRVRSRTPMELPPDRKTTSGRFLLPGRL